MMAQRRNLDMFTKGRIVGMLKSSRSQTEVSRILDVDLSVISRLWQRFQRTGDVTRQPVLGQPRVASPRQDRYLVISAQFGAHSRHMNTNFETNCSQETQSCWHICQKTSNLHSPHVCA
ncbi:transposable element Tc3 transposase [Trichonephila clavipes]|nr:transposable element Tc3 transposase [Trichonephila clavipes]